MGDWLTHLSIGSVGPWVISTLSCVTSETDDAGMPVCQRCASAEA